MKTEPKPDAVVGPLEATFRPRAWLTTRTLDGKQTLRLAETTANAEYARAHAHWKWEPLYDQAALDAALNLWPRDCRLCANYTTSLGGCMSTVRCVDSDQYSATAPHQYWLPGHNV